MSGTITVSDGALFQIGDVVEFPPLPHKWWHPISDWWKEFKWRCRYDLMGVIESRPWLYRDRFFTITGVTSYTLDVNASPFDAWRID